MICLLWLGFLVEFGVPLSGISECDGDSIPMWMDVPVSSLFAGVVRFCGMLCLCWYVWV